MFWYKAFSGLVVSLAANLRKNYVHVNMEYLCFTEITFFTFRAMVKHLGIFSKSFTAALKFLMAMRGISLFRHRGANILVNNGGSGVFSQNTTQASLFPAALTTSRNPINRSDLAKSNSSCYYSEYFARKCSIHFQFARLNIFLGFVFFFLAPHSSFFFGHGSNCCFVCVNIICSNWGKISKNTKMFLY